MHWQAARLACQALGGKLGSVTSSEENHIVTELGREVKSALWTGGCNSRSGWSWEDGNRWSFTAWPSCEKNTRYFFDPHIGEDEHKVHLGGAQGEGLPRRLPVRLAGTVFKPNHSWITHGLDDIWLIFDNIWMVPCRQVEDPSETRRFVCKIKERMEGEDYKVLWIL